MQELVSPGSSVTILDESLFTQAQETCVPLIIMATAAEKSHPFTATAFAVNTVINGVECVNCAIGTFEHGVVRTITGMRQSLELYGVPKFLESADGQPHHGDARNEYGLLALNHFLAQGRKAYVVRANVNLDDDITNVTALWQKRIEDTADLFETLFAEYVRNYNASNRLVPLDSGYKVALSAAEVKTLLRQALGTRAFTDYSFSNTVFQDDFLRDHGVPSAGYVDVQLDDTRGFIVGTDTTGLDPLVTYQINIGVDGYAPNGQPYPSAGSFISVDGADGHTYAALVAALNTALSAATFVAATTTTTAAPTTTTTAAPSSTTAAPTTTTTAAPTTTVAPTPKVVASLLNGRIRFTSTTVGVTSHVVLSNAGLTTPLFTTAALTDVISFLTPVLGNGNLSLRVYTDSTYSVLNATDAEFDGLDAAIDAAAIGTPTFTLASAIAVLNSAATEFEHTQEFRHYTSLGANDAARRVTITTALIREILTNEFIRNELYEHNIVLCPGYPEVNAALDDFIKSRAIKEEVFGLEAVPLNVSPDGPGGLLEWNATNAVKGANFAEYYPHPLMANADGKLVVGDSTAIALRTFAYNDYVGEPWFAPAGVRRGSATGVSDVGYVSGELGGPTEFVQVHLQEGQRDSMYVSNINPITFFPTTGIVVWGQKTTQGFASAMDRVAVSRMVKYIARGLRKGSLPFVFEQNDYITREQFRAMIDNFLNIVLLRRGLYDYAVICNESNNTQARIERNEMWGDVAIKPTKQAEFIYVPIRVVSTTADIGTNRTVQLNRR